MKLYNGEELPCLKIQYKDYSEWQSSESRRASFVSEESFWLNEFAGELPDLNLPLDYPRPETFNYEGRTVEFTLNAEQTAALRDLALREGVTVQILMLTLLNILFSKVCGQEDIIIGTPAAGRKHADLAAVIGVFVNTLALRNFPTAEKSFREFLQEVGERSLMAYDNQDYPFDDLIRKIWVNRDRVRNPLFDVMFEIFTITEELKGEAKPESQANRPERRITKMDIDWYGVEYGRRINFTVYYSTLLFKRETIERLTGHYLEIIEQVLANNKIRLKDIALSHTFVAVQSRISQEEEGDFGF